jgi:hypothetical protein
MPPQGGLETEQLPRRSKRKYLAFGCENPIKKLSRQRLIIYFLISAKHQLIISAP